MECFYIVTVAWIFSVCLHEFGHAVVAYKGGDYTVRDKGYLTFNPLKYTDPLFSIILPVLFVALGGIGLPGGAVPGVSALSGDQRFRVKPSARPAPGRLPGHRALAGRRISRPWHGHV